MNARLDVVISLAPAASNAAVLERLVAAGLEEAEIQGALGTVTGRVAADRLDALRAVEGVEAVEVSRAVHI